MQQMTVTAIENDNLYTVETNGMTLALSRHGDYWAYELNNQIRTKTNLGECLASLLFAQQQDLSVIS